MTMAEQFGLVRGGTCWCCAGLGVVVDDWDVVQQCLFCDGTGDEPGGDAADDGSWPSPNYLAQFRATPTEAEMDEDTAALRRALDEIEGTDEG